MGTSGNKSRITARRLLWLLGFVLLAALLWPAAREAVRSYPWSWPHWRAVDWSSAGLLPAPDQEPDAAVHVLSARAATWRGIFASHAWIVLKEEGANRYRRWEVLGWGRHVRRDAYDADGKWFGNTPRVLFAMHGDAAARLIPRIEAEIARYPAPDRYRMWPGPNSNTFVAHVSRRVDGLDPVLPDDAVGKDFLMDDAGQPRLFDTAPSHTGWQASAYGMAGLTFAGDEGLRVNLFGLSMGIRFD